MVANVVRKEERERGNIQIKEHVKTNRDRKYTSYKNKNKNKNPDQNIQECVGRKHAETEKKIAEIQDEAMVKQVGRRKRKWK